MKPVFIRLENPASTQDLVLLLRKKVADANEILNNLKRLRSAEDSELSSWNQEMKKAEQVMAIVQKELMDAH